MAFVAMAVLGSFALHILYCRLLKIDVDTMLVTSTSAIMSPPFVGLTAVALGNREIVMAGITTGLIGYAAGNYLGILVAQVLRLLS
jgi:uncharacterized membrane protein